MKRTLNNYAGGNQMLAKIAGMVKERRLPYRLQGPWDRTMIRLGSRRKTLVADGLRVTVRRQTCDEAFVQNVIIDREYNPPGWDILPGQTVIDVGGNIGTFALLASRTAGRVISIEPNSENVAMFRENLARNRIKNVTVIQAAMAGERGTLTLHCANEGGYHTLENRTDFSKSETVPAIRLQDVFEEHGIDRCDFLKVDCEGAEYDIFRGLPAEYFGKIRKIAMETHGSPDPDERLRLNVELMDRLKVHGFSIECYVEHSGARSGVIRARHA